MSTTDYLHLSEHKIFNQLRDALPKELTKAQSLIAIRDDILYAWDHQDISVLALNIKAVRVHKDETINHQTLFPYSPPLFTPDRLIVNESNTLIAAYGPNGVLLFELPGLTPPYGTFNNNKEINYTRTCSLHERALAFNTKIEVRQVRFHPGSPQDNHVCLLTNDNIFRVFCYENGSASLQEIIHVGPSITCNVPSSHISIQEALGETAVDFDFGPPEASQQPNSLTKKDLKWPIYFLAGDATIHIVTVTLGDKVAPVFSGPHTIQPLPDGKISSEYCSILVLPTTPPLMSIANCNGHISHILTLDNFNHEKDSSESPRKSKNTNNKILVLLETLELELGYTIGNYSADAEYSCPIYLHKDEGRLGVYYATHEAGIHSIEVGCTDALNAFIDNVEDMEEEALLTIVNEQSAINYLLCTKTSEDVGNAVTGFALYYNPHSYLSLLANGQLVTLPVVTMPLPQQDFDEHDMETLSSPLKKMLSDPFDVQIQRMLKQGSAQPILKLPSNEGKTQQDCYELIQRAGVSLREQIANHKRAKVEIEKRIKALILLKEYQRKELENINDERTQLQENAEKLAEKYEDLNDKQNDILHRCQKLLISISKHQDVPSNAEKEFHVKLKTYEGKMEHVSAAIEKLRKKIKYQDCQMRNHQTQTQKNRELGADQSESFKRSLQETTQKIGDMMKDVTEYKKQLNLY